MIFLQLNVLSKQMAILEIVVVLVIAALMGYMLSQLIAYSRLRLLKREIVQRQSEIRECRFELTVPSSVAAKPPIRKITKPVHPVSEPMRNTSDDLKIIEGIGPKIEEILNKHGIKTYLALAITSPVRISAILKTAGPRFQIQDSSTWPEQATLADEGKWEELEKVKIKLISGRHGQS